MASFEDKLSNAIEGGMPLDAKLYGARGESVKDFLDVKEPSAPDNLDDLYLAMSPEEQRMSLDDVVQGTPASYGQSSGTANIIANQVGMFDQDNIETMRSDLKTQGMSQIMEAVLQEKNEQSANAFRAEAIDVLVNPEASGADKEKAKNDLLTAPQPKEPAMLIMEQSYKAGVPNLTPAEQDTYNSTRAYLQQSLDYLHEKQAMSNLMNKEVTSSEAVMANLGVDFFVPFRENYTVSELAKFGGVELDASLELGAQKSQFRDVFLSWDFDKRIDYIHNVKEAMREGKLGLTADLQVFQALEDMTSNGAYTEDDAFWDTAFSYMDAAGVATGIGLLATRGIGVLRKAATANTVNTVEPLSPAMVASQANPNVGRAIDNAVVSDETGEAANNFYGTNRDDAIASERLSQVADEFGSFDAKTPLDISKETKNVLERDGTVYITKEEDVGFEEAARKGFTEVRGVQVRPNMTAVRSKDKATTTIKGVYGTEGLGAFTDAGDALAKTLVALRKFGVTQDNVTVMRREGGEFVPTTVSDEEAFKAMDAVALQKGTEPLFGAKREYVVAVDYDVPNELLEPSTGYSHLRVFGANKFMNLGGDVTGTVAQNLLTKSIQFQKEVGFGATAADHRRTALLDSIAGDATAAVQGLRGKDRDVLNELLIRGDSEGRKMNGADVYAAGGSEEAAQAIESWNQAMDDLYHVTNRDLITTLRAQGWSRFIDETTDTELLVKELSNVNAGKVVEVYDATTGKVIKLDNGMRKDLYGRGGTIGELQHEIDIDGAKVGHVIVQNRPGSYARALSDSDRVLNYRAGYVPRKYDDKDLFVDMTITDSSGKKRTRAVATAKNSIDAQRITDELRGNNPDAMFDFRESREAQGNPFTDLNRIGRSTNQRVRGKQLEGSLTGEPNIRDPFESMSMAVQSVANRASMRNYMMHMKARFIDNFGNVLPRDEYGRPRFPMSADEISGGEYAGLSKLAEEAKSNYNNIRQLENGYINSLGKGQRALFNYMGRLASKLDKSGKFEEVFRGAGGVDATSAAMRTASATFISLNFIAQAMMGTAHTMMVMSAYPQSAAKFMRSLPLIVDYRNTGKINGAYVKASGMTMGEAKQMLKDLDESKMLEGVDGNYIIRECLMEASDANAMHNKGLLRKAGVMAGNALTALPRTGAKLGSELGAKMVNASAWFIMRERKIGETGSSKFTAKDKEEIVAKASELAGNPGRQHDMAYTHNIAKPFFQFIQMSHKMAMAPFSKGLTKAEKVQLGTAFLLTMPKPAWLYDSIAEIVDPAENEETFNFIVDGLYGYIINKTASMVYEDTDIDFGRLSPLDPGGFISTFVALMQDETLAQALAGTGAAAVGGKVMDSAANIANWANPFAENDDMRTLGQISFSEARNWAPFLNNAEKGRIAHESGYLYSTNGNVMGWDLNKAEATGAALGLAPKDVTMSYNRGRKLQDAEAKVKDEAKQYYGEIRKMAHDMDMSIADQDFPMFMAGKLASYKGEHKKAFLKEFNNQLKFDLQKRNDPTLAKIILRSCKVGYASPEDVRQTIKLSRLDDKTIENLNLICDSVYSEDSYKE